MSVYTYHYGRVPEPLLYSNASDRACRLHALLTRWGDTKPDKQPTRQELAGQLRCSVDSLDRAIKELEDGGFLKVMPQYAEGTRVRVANDYRLEDSRKDAATDTSGNGESAGDGGRVDAATGTEEGGRTGAAANRKKGSKRQPKKKEGSAAQQPRPEVHELCQLLADRIIGNGGGPAVYQPRVTTDAWQDSMRLLVDKDLAVDSKGQPIEPQERLARVRKAINWCQDDDFWRRQILSPGNLREKYDRLRLAAMPANGHGSRNGADRRPPPEIPEADLATRPPRHDPVALMAWSGRQVEEASRT